MGGVALQMQRRAAKEPGLAPGAFAAPVEHGLEQLADDCLSRLGEVLAVIEGRLFVHVVALGQSSCTACLCCCGWP
jgi:hypothetical protein